MPDDRDRYADVAQAARDVLRRANQLELSVRDRKVLDAVMAFTALYSRMSDRVYLAQLAAFAFGADDAKPWMAKKTRESLGRLRDEGLIVSEAPKGRPATASHGPSYLVGLAISDPGTGVRSRTESDPERGVSSIEEVTPDLDRKRPRSRTESDPEAWTPTEKVPEKIPEEREGVSNVERARALLWRQDHSLSDEVVSLVAQLEGEHGTDTLARWLADLHAARRTFEYPSQLRKALPVRKDQQVVKEMLTKPGHECELCTGGWIEDETSAVSRCPNLQAGAA